MSPESNNLSGVRVALVSRIFAPEPAAASLRLSALTRELAESGAKVRVLTTMAPRGFVDAGQLPLQDDVQVRRAPVFRDRAGYVRGYLQYLSFDIPVFFRLLFTTSVDLVVVEPPPTTGAVVRLACALKRVPYVYYAADIWSDAAQSTSTPRLVVRTVRAFEKWAMTGADLVISASQEFTERLVQLGVRSEVRTIGNGVDLNQFSLLGPTYSGDVPYFLYAGTASEVHGATIFLEAFERVLRSGHHAKLVFVGQGSDREQMEEIARRLPTGTVEFHRRISPQEVSVWFRGAVASLASVKPGGYDRAFPTKMYASVACGTRVIYSGTGPGRKFAAQPRLGWSVDYDVGAVAGAMVEALNSPVNDALRETIGFWAAQNVSIDAVAKRAVSQITRRLREWTR